MSEVYITSATRTAVGSFNGSLASLPAHDLGKVVIEESLRRSQLQSTDIDEVIFIDRPVKEVIEDLRPDYVVKGKEYENIFNEELEVVENYGGCLVFSSGEVVFSSIDLIRIFTDSSSKVKVPPIAVP